ncbi:beta-mannosidase [Puniceicoccus vermicola]|uniref:Beta-mannosidase B n=1 Tax=Puniceicoccus vermicola TaxID=388746 RepID=A0A7X1E3H2_9BACT|nr:glycoside hydrolase family 2 protein [Puniceicoccus vermicola]MBC2600979.1 glycoside hydrolase family 2 protein [Puniceicoccus vermicola]
MKTQSLNSEWTFLSPKDKQWLPAEVPGCVHTDLLRHELIPDPYWGRNELDLQHLEEKDWTYRLDFDLDESLLEQTYVDLVAEGLDTVATITLNGTEVGTTENMFIGHRFEVKKLLQTGSNHLEIHFTSPMKYIRSRPYPGKMVENCEPVGGRSLIRKEQCSFGWDWGPRYPSSGIWRPIQLEAWSENRIESVHIAQHHGKKTVDLKFTPHLTRGKSAKLRGTIELDDETVSTFEGDLATIKNPQLWWPHGHGEQPLYTVTLELLNKEGEVIDTWSKRVGLRTIVLDRHKDEFGESFQFVINGRPIFAKGANWIPADSFPHRVDRAWYDKLLSDATAVHMNMIRVWGGGIYESEDFYDLCDEKGLLVWQDFMFACCLYPADRAFVKNVKAEAEQQVKRLSYRTCLALWCGNNELEQLSEKILETKARKKAYEKVFYDVIPEIVERLDGITTYWPCSPHNPEGYEKGHNNESAGDSHFWDVWHARKPVNTYETKFFRFCSEFGMQSYSSPEVARTYCNPEDMNPFGPVMEIHQKNGAGNLIILDYVLRLFRFPKDYRALSYLSQLNQAHCMKVGIEHFRRCMPRTMGALYWQLNDCWPVASWSSLEYTGKWKAVHFEAQRFFAPALLSVKILGEESLGANNTRINTMHGAEIHTVYDSPEDDSGKISWALQTLDGKTIRKGSKKVKLQYGQSVLQETLDFSKEIEAYGQEEIFLRVDLAPKKGEPTSRTALFSAQRFLGLRRDPIQVDCQKIGANEIEITLQSKTLHLGVQVDFPERGAHYSENFIDLYPNVPHTIRATFPDKITVVEARKLVDVYSLIDSY